MMQQFQSTTTDIDGVKIITPFFAHDERGSFLKDYSAEQFAQFGIRGELAETAYITSEKNVLRGLHFQRERQQPKLLRCISGAVLCVIVDLRANSDTYKKHLFLELSENNMKEVYIPAGAAIGCLTLEKSLLTMKYSEKYYKEYDDGILWSDPDLGIVWPVAADQLILSEKDRHLQSFREFTEKYGSL